MVPKIAEMLHFYTAHSSLIAMKPTQAISQIQFFVHKGFDM